MSAVIDPATLSLPEKIVEHVGFANAALEKASGVIRGFETKQAKASALIPQAVDALVAGDRIQDNPQQREKAAAMLRDPEQALQLLIKVATHRNAQEGTVGRPHSEKQASHNTASNPYVGRRSSDVQDSDRALFAGLGLSVPG